MLIFHDCKLLSPCFQYFMHSYKLNDSRIFSVIHKLNVVWDNIKQVEASPFIIKGIFWKTRFNISGLLNVQNIYSEHFNEYKYRHFDGDSCIHIRMLLHIYLHNYLCMSVNNINYMCRYNCHIFFKIYDKFRNIFSTISTFYP